MAEDTGAGLRTARSLFLIVVISCVMGTFLPFFFMAMSIEPANAGPTMQVLMDIIGVIITCAICEFVLNTHNLKVRISSCFPPPPRRSTEGGGHRIDRSRTHHHPRRRQLRWTPTAPHCLSYQQLLVTRFAASTTHGQLSAAKGSSTTVPRSDSIQFT